MKELEAKLHERVIGQEAAVQKVAKAVRRSRAGLKSKNRPVGSFLFVGPTGVGKQSFLKRWQMNYSAQRLYYPPRYERIHGETRRI